MNLSLNHCLLTSKSHGERVPMSVCLTHDLLSWLSSEVKTDHSSLCVNVVA